MSMFWCLLANYNVIIISNIISQMDAREMNKAAVLFAMLLKF